MTDSVELSIIIPSLNEEVALPPLLLSLKSQRGIRVEIVVADGGSLDGTAGVAMRAGARFVKAPRGRAAQMNAGAENSSAKILLFLHADSVINDDNLLSNALKFFKEKMACSKQGRIAGHFPLKFIRSSSAADLAYSYYEAKTHLNRPDTTNGDQGLLIERRFFEELGGFDESLPFLEDQRIAARIRTAGSLVTLPGLLETSARRFEQEGLSRRMILSAMIMGLHAIEFTPFFVEAPAIYREQRNSSRLMMRPFFALIDKQLKAEGLSKFFKNWLGIGRYVRKNAWQPFLFCDVCLEKTFKRRERMFLTFYDRTLSRALDFAFFDALAAVITYIWFVSEWGYFSFADRKTT